MRVVYYGDINKESTVSYATKVQRFDELSVHGIKESGND